MESCYKGRVVSGRGVCVFLAVAYLVGLSLPYDSSGDREQREQHSAWHVATDGLEQAPPCPFHAREQVPEPPGWKARCPCGCGDGTPDIFHGHRGDARLTAVAGLRLRRPGPVPAPEPRAAARPGHVRIPEPVPLSALSTGV